MVIVVVLERLVEVIEMVTLSMLVIVVVEWQEVICEVKVVQAQAKDVQKSTPSA